MKISVKDEGEGFDLASVAEPRESTICLKKTVEVFF
jgi:hypothetical protein